MASPSRTASAAPRPKGLRYLRTRIALVFVALFVFVMALAAILVARSTSQIARETSAQVLEQGERVFRRLLAQNQARLTQGAATISADADFRRAIANGDAGTIVSILRKYGPRVGASAMTVVSADGVVRVDTHDERQVGRPFAFPELVRDTSGSEPASAIVILGARPHQLVVVPVPAPPANAWVVFASEVTDATAQEWKVLTGLEVSMASRPAGGGPWALMSSTLVRPQRESLAAALAGVEDSTLSQGAVLLGDDEYETRLTNLAESGGVRIAAVLQKPLAEGLAPFRRLGATLLVLAFAALGLLVAGSFALAKDITQPLNRLTEAARRIQEGDYRLNVEVEQADEIGELAVSFNHMLDGIARRETEILRLAYEDGLTALPNRAMFNRQLEQSVREAKRNDKTLTVMILDMDRFKTINDTLGHPVGDQVLREVGARVRAVLRESDVVARLGGDEFAVLLASGEADLARTVAVKIIKALEAPLAVEGQPMDVAASIGIAHFPRHGGDAVALLRAADVAMYAAKRTKSGHSTYDPEYDERRQEHLTLLGELRQAVESDQLVLHYQPKVSLVDRRTSAAEALVRWRHPVRDFIPPSEFIGFAEQTGYIGVITQWVIKRAIDQCGLWHRAGYPIRVSVNVSARDLRIESGLLPFITHALAAAQVPPSLLCVEVTESGLMEDPAGAQETLRKLRDLGVAASIDDYGTGYSSLAYIKQLAVSELKIDRTFVGGMEEAGNAAIVRSTIDLGHNLGLLVVAEGVETDLELDKLSRFGCDFAQGYRFARAMPADEFERWLAK
jgi:diguanylate cyclase (GGDEF)-like protein